MMRLAHLKIYFCLALPTTAVASLQDEYRTHQFDYPIQAGIFLNYWFKRTMPSPL